MKKIIALLLSLLVLTGLFAACGKEAANSGQTDPAAEANSLAVQEKAWYFGADKDKFKSLSIDQPLDVAAVYAGIQYNELFLEGIFKLEKESDLKKVKKDNATMELSYYSNSYIGAGPKTETVCAVPTQIIAGAYTIACRGSLSQYSGVKQQTDAHWALLYFATADDKTAQVLCTYEVEGKTVRYYPVADFQSTETDGAASFTYTPGTKALTYTFDFSGPYLSLTDGQNSVTLCSENFCADASTGPQFSGYALPDSPLLADMVSGSSLGGMFVPLKDGGGIWHLGIKFESNGLATLIWDDAMVSVGGKEIHHFSKQVVYWATSLQLIGGQFIFADADHVYYYTDCLEQNEQRLMSGYYDDDALNGLTDQQMKEISQKRSDLFKDLAEALNEAGIAATIDRSLGEVALDNTVLFAGDSSELTAQGKEFLRAFVNVYTRIIYSKKYTGFIQSVMIEGHTAPLANSTYESGLPLSTERSEKVKAYCLSDDVNLPANIQETFRSTLQARGVSNSRPVYDADGKVDPDASRRVSFTFLVDLGQ